MYRYSKTWFLGSEIRKHILRICPELFNKNSVNKILEIGCYEGLSSVFFADNLLNNKESFLICVDPFLDTPANVEETFFYNITLCKNYDRIQINKITSDHFFQSNQHIFNFIYIDGCHKCDFIMRDMENSFQYLEKNGIMWMDDYLGGDGIQIRNTMEEFLRKYNGQYEIIHRGYQLAIRKK